MKTPKPNINYKNELQEFCQKNKLILPVYSHDRHGTDHNPIFVSTVVVCMNDRVYENYAESNSKKNADKKAAKRLLSFLEETPILVSVSLIFKKSSGSNNSISTKSSICISAFSIIITYPLF